MQLFTHLRNLNDLIQENFVELESVPLHITTSLVHLIKQGHLFFYGSDCLINVLAVVGDE